jgi:hypothetical protein
MEREILYEYNRDPESAAPWDFSPSALGSYEPQPPIILKQRPRLSDSEPIVVDMGHKASFAGYIPDVSEPPTDSKPTSLTDSIFKSAGL